jgi:flagellar hook-basal body complex protein FliE
MSIESISSVTSAAEMDPSFSMSATTGINQTNQFSDMVTQGLEQVNKKLLTTETDLQQLATGDVQSLHQVMMRMEESQLSFQLMMQVRNRLLEAYQSVMTMQI